MTTTITTTTAGGTGRSGTTTENPPTAVDPVELRAEVRVKYAEVARTPGGHHHFHTGRPLARMLGYPAALVEGLPGAAIDSFAGVDNPFRPARIPVGGRVVDLGSGGGFDCFVAAELVGRTGRVVGVDMTPEMLERSRAAGELLGAEQVEFRSGILEDLPVEDGWADVVISNGVLNLVADKARVLAEAHRVLRPGGVLQFADIAVGRTVPEAARCDIELWTDCIAGGLSLDQWTDAIDRAGFEAIAVGIPTDTFGGAAGESRARSYDVSGHTFRAVAP